MSAVRRKVNIARIVGKGYKSFWDYKGRYRVVKGGRGSKKSTTMALWLIYSMMKYPLANALVVRRFFNGHKDSTWTQLRWATNKLGVSHLWSFSRSPLEAVYIPTGQRILFRGMDDPQSITSITVEKGFLCWVWVEEAFQLPSEADFDKLDMSIRGELPEGYYKQITLTFNPWSERHWLKKRFFDSPDPDVLALTTSFKCNEFLGSDDIAIFEKMKRDNPRRYSIEGEGNWGIATGLVYNSWVESDFDATEVAKRPGVSSAYGLDFGFSADPTAFIACLIDEQNKEIYLHDEHYERGMLNSDIANVLKYKGYSKSVIFADSAEPKSIEEIRKLGISRIRPCKKGADSIRSGIQKLQEYRIYVHPKCTNTLVELSNYVWDSKDDSPLNRPVDDFNHVLDALRYSMSGNRGNGLSVLK